MGKGKIPLSTRHAQTKKLTNQHLEDTVQYATTGSDISLMARELLKLRNKLVAWEDYKNHVRQIYDKQTERLAAAEKVVEKAKVAQDHYLKRTDWFDTELDEALEAYDTLVVSLDDKVKNN